MLRCTMQSWILINNCFREFISSFNDDLKTILCRNNTKIEQSLNIDPRRKSRVYTVRTEQVAEVIEVYFFRKSNLFVLTRNFRSELLQK